MAALGIDVTLRYALKPSDHPGGEDDTGSYLASGLVAITAGPQRSQNIFTLASLKAVAPNFPQVFPVDSNSDCGASGPIAIEKLLDSKYPAVVVTTTIVVKGCLPIVHAFVPSTDTSTVYAPVVAYAVTHPIRPFRGMRVIPFHPDGSLRVMRIRSIRLPNAPNGVPYAVHNWTIAILDGIGNGGKRATIALDRPGDGEMPDIGETIAIFNTPAADGRPSIRLSAGHEGRYQQAHPPAATLPTPPPPPLPQAPGPSPTFAPPAIPPPSIPSAPEPAPTAAPARTP
jgi:hypothetical protein